MKFCNPISAGFHGCFILDNSDAFAQLRHSNRGSVKFMAMTFTFLTLLIGFSQEMAFGEPIPPDQLRSMVRNGGTVAAATLMNERHRFVPLECAADQRGVTIRENPISDQEALNHFERVWAVETPARFWFPGRMKEIKTQLNGKNCGLRDVEIYAISEYTSVGYGDINRALRTGNATLIERFAITISLNQFWIVQTCSIQRMGKAFRRLANRTATTPL